MKELFSKIKLPIKILVSFGILALLFHRMDMSSLKQVSHNVHFSAWGFAIFFILIQLFLLSWRWMLLINIGRTRMNYAMSLQVTLASQIANLLLIPIVTGVIVRVAAALQCGASLFKALFASALDRAMTLTALSLFCAVFLPALSYVVESNSLRGISIFVAICLLSIFVVLPAFSLILLPKIPEKFLSKADLRSGIRYLILLFNNRFLLTKILMLSLLAQLCFFLAVYVLAVSSGAQISFIQLMIVLPAISIVSSLPISFGGWGVREGAFMYGLGLLGVSSELAFSASVQTGLTGIIATIVAGLPALIIQIPSSGYLNKDKNEAK